jgi:ABC-type molybdate transport system ATPase subunit
MLAISRALMLRPKLLLLDEPVRPGAADRGRDLPHHAQINVEDGVSMLLVEQNASLALDLAHHAYLLETGHGGPVRPGRADQERRVGAPRLPRLLNQEPQTAMEAFLHQITSGLANGIIYGSVAWPW